MSLYSSATRTIQNIWRLKEIASVLMKHGFADILERINLGKYIPLSKLSRKTDERTPLPVRIAEAFCNLGPTFVKLGQQLSQRSDLLSEEFTSEFAKLQDSVRPFDGDEALALLEDALGEKSSELFAEFDKTPMASGSIAQVHAATLKDGLEVVVKIQRPGIGKIIKTDLRLCAQLAELAERHSAELSILRPTQLIDEFSRSLLRELDFNAEASSISKFASSFAKNKNVVIPDVIWTHTRSCVLTQKRLKGIPLTDITPATTEVDKKALALNVGKCFLEQLFEHGTFHADPHPGNLIAIGRDRVGLIDFGAVGHISDDMVSELAAIFYALSIGDVALIASVYEELGVIDELTVDRGAMLSEFQSFFDRYYGLPAERLDMRLCFTDGLAIARTHGAHLPRELVLFGRAFVSVIASIKQLDSSIKISELVKPYVHKLVLGRISPKQLAKLGARSGYHISSLIKNLPGDLRAIVRMIRQGRMRFEFVHRGLNDVTKELDHASSRLSFSVVIAAVIIGSSSLMTSDVGPKWSALNFLGLGEVPLLGLVGFLVAGFMGLGLAWSIYRSGKLQD